MIRHDGNQVYFEGDLGQEPRSALVCLHQLTHDRGYPDIQLDFSQASYADAGFMLPITSYLTYLRFNRIDADIILPENPSLSRLFLNANWAHFMCPSKFAHNMKRKFNNLPALQFLDGDAQYQVVNQAMDILMEPIEVSNRNQLKALEWALNETTDNVLNHSESPIGGFVQIHTFPARKRVVFYVVDAGLGICQTLRKSVPDLTSDADALDRAIREGVTRNSKTNQGNGLYGTFKCCEQSNGEFHIRSNRARLSYKDGSLSISSDSVPFGGSYLRATINYDSEQLLEKALVFKGRVHTPENDYIDMKYVHIGDKLLFNVKDEVDGFGSREFGKRAKRKIDNILTDRNVGILFDFSEIALVSSSFADEVFGKLFFELGPMEFLRRCEFRAIDATVRKLIDRAIAQRMKIT